MQSATGQTIGFWLLLIGAACYGFWIKGGFRKFKLESLKEFWRGPWSRNKRISLLLGVLFVVAAVSCLVLYFVLLDLWTGGAPAVVPP